MRVIAEQFQLTQACSVDSGVSGVLIQVSDLTYSFGG